MLLRCEHFQISQPEFLSSPWQDVLFRWVRTPLAALVAPLQLQDGPVVVPGVLSTLQPDAPGPEKQLRRAYYNAQVAGLGGLDGRRNKGFVKVVDDVSLMARKTATVGIVGESGCGKTTLAKCIVGLESPHSGKMDFIGIDVARVVEQRHVERFEELQMIFQNPDSTLNPKRSVGEPIARPLQLFGTVPAAEIGNGVVRLLEAVRLGETYLGRLSRRLSSGEKQRVALARAFAGRPTLVLCDEPTTTMPPSLRRDRCW